MSGGDSSFIGIGLSASNSNLNCLPGWKHNTYGYHGDDGRLFEFSFHGRGKSYGPRFTTNDTIGKEKLLIIKIILYYKDYWAAS